MFPLQDDVVNYKPAVLVWLLILVNGFIFFSYGLGGQAAYESVIYQYGTIPEWVTSPGQQNPTIPDFFTLFTSMFLHGGLMHLAGNMYFLYLFGDNVEEKMGELSFIAFYLLTGLIAGLVHIATDPGSEVPAVGASGAISGVLGAYMVMFPRATVRTIIAFGFLTVVDISALFFLGFWFLGQLFSGIGALITPEKIGIAFWAHIGGFASGALLALIWPKDRRVPTEYNELGSGFHRFNNRDFRRGY